MVSVTEYINKQKAIREKGVTQYRKQIEVLAKKGIVVGTNGNLINTNNKVNGVANTNTTNPNEPNYVPTVETTLAFDPETYEFYNIQEEGPRKIDGVSRNKPKTEKKPNGVNVPYSVIISITLIAIVCAVFLFVRRKRDNTKETVKTVANAGTLNDDDTELLSSLPQAKQSIPDTYKPIFNVNVNDNADPNYYGYQNEVPQRLSTYNNADGYAMSNVGQYDGQFDEFANPYGNLLNQNYVDGNNVQFNTVNSVNQAYQDPANLSFNYANQTYPEVATSIPLTNVNQIYPEGTIAVPLNTVSQVYPQATIAVPINTVSQVYPQGTIAVPLNTVNQVYTEVPGAIQFNSVNPVTNQMTDISFDSNSVNIVNNNKGKEPDNN